MTTSHPNSEDLIAPCGMNCAICSRYLAYVNQLKRSQCRGCRPGQIKCTYLFTKCTGLNHVSNGKTGFCFDCDQYPCRHIKRMDNRYRKNYNMSIRNNLEFIQKEGLVKFLEDQTRRYQCTKCGGLISIHNRKCFKCDTITRLVEKQTQD